MTGNSRRRGSAAGAVALLVLSAACGTPEEREAPSAPQSPAQTARTDVPSEPAAASASPDPAPTSEPAAIRDVPLSYESDDGTRITVDLRLSEVIPASDADRVRATLRALDGSDTDLRSGPCQQSTLDENRDATVLGTVSFTNETPDYPVDSLSLLIQVPTTSAVSGFGVRYSDEERCFTPTLASPGHVTPNMNGETWGPAPVSFAIAGLYGPNHPDGDPAVLENTGVNASLIANSEVIFGFDAFSLAG